MSPAGAGDVECQLRVVLPSQEVCGEVWGAESRGEPLTSLCCFLDWCGLGSWGGAACGCRHLEAVRVNSMHTLLARQSWLDQNQGVCLPALSVTGPGHISRARSRWGWGVAAIRINVPLILIHVKSLSFAPKESR